MAYQLLPLPYSFDALEPYLDARTVEIHYTKHHQSYVDNLNKAIVQHPELGTKPVEELLANLQQVPEDIRMAVRNQGGGYANHTLFWMCMGPRGKNQPSGKLAQEITQTFGSFDVFKQQLSDKAKQQFASGWAWLIIDQKGNLAITSTPNHDTPLSVGCKSLLCIDVWEHAYYLKFQNRRVDFIEAWWNVVHWDYIEQLYRS